MRSLIFIAALFSSTLAFSQDSAYSDSLTEARQKFADKVLNTDYILNGMEQKGLDTLSYFPVDTTWRIKSRLIRDKGKRFEMPTSTDRTPKYRRYGWLCITHGDTTFRLAAYKNLELKGKEYKYYLFVPFKDANAPKTTYGAGRYIDVYRKRGSDDVIVDFNTAYNPYCAYSHRYSCPITPSENHVDFKINAGEKLPVQEKQYR